MAMAKRFLIFIFVVAVILAGCGGGSPSVVETQTEVFPTSIPATMEPSPTDIPPANKVLFATGSQLPDPEIQIILSTLQEMAAADGLIFEAVPALTPALITLDVKIAVTLPPDPGIADLSSRYPSISFVSVAVPGIQPSGNLYVAGSEGSHPEWDAFIAGYIAAVITEDWRGGVMTQAGTNEGLLAGDAFVNGMRFFCGLCQKKVSPFNYDPPVIQMNPATSMAEWQPYADALIATRTKTAYIYPGIANPEMMAYLAQNGVKLIGSQPPQESFRSEWVATVTSDYSSGLLNIWQGINTGATGFSVPVNLKLSDIDPNLITDGKIRLINEVITTLTSGAISPNTIQ